jgi:hypothetical protein
MLDFLDPTNPWLQAAGALVLLLAGFYLGAGQKQRERWHAIVDEVHPVLERQVGAVSPAAALDPDLQRRLVRAASWWKRPRLQRALREYESARRKWRQDEAGQPLFDDPDAHARAVRRLLRLLS